MIKAIIFDCFGVLAGKGFKEIYKEAGGDLAKNGTFLDDVLGAANSGMITSKDMHQQVADTLGMSYEAWRETIRIGELPNQKLLDYVKELKKKYKVGILSNANRSTMENTFNTQQLALFDAVVVSAHVGFMKPQPEIYELAAERLGVKPSECVFTDDSPTYSQACEVVGMKGIWYQDFEQMKHDLEELLASTNN